MLLEPAESAAFELVSRRSRFVATIAPAATRADAEAAIARASREHPHASHVVYAFLLGDPASEIADMSDAGEPKGTAGRPVMEILRGSGVRDVVVTIVRYFGGTKLGTGGLVRAYGDAARGALEALPVRPRIHRVTLRASLPYELHETARRLIVTAGGTILDESYAELVTLVWEIPGCRRASLEQQLIDASRGSVRLEDEREPE